MNMEPIKPTENINPIEVFCWIDHDQFFDIDAHLANKFTLHKDKPDCKRPVRVKVTIDYERD